MFVPGLPAKEIKVTEENVPTVPAAEASDNVNHPEHYTKGIEVYDFADSWELDFRSFNVVKYVCRAPYKGQQLEDLKKARWYLDKLIEKAEKA